MILLVNGEPLGRERVNNVKNYVPINPLTSEWVLRALIDFTLSNARRFYSSMGNLLDGKGLREVEPLVCEAATSLRILVGISSNDCYELPLKHSGHIGRPRFGVSRAQLEYLLRNDFTGKQISEML